ncbi:hypothetical protein IFM89_001592 [Coptis chinensis]|uniref:Uncharacterized protein n=1 Tax=Coptis chinensis TaxID=261450 RepID=A0A835HIH8_9MAGN|nr:hypothetical protein IFM89_001592 [Coptis chinensis]
MWILIHVYLVNIKLHLFLCFGIEEALSRPCSIACAFFESIIEQVIPEDLLTVHSEIVRAGEVKIDADVSEDMHCDESASGAQEGSNDMSSESDPFLAPTYESEDSTYDIEVNEQGEWINVVFGPVNLPSLVNVRLLDENMSLTTTLLASRGENVEGGIGSGSPQVEPKIHNGNSSSPVDNIFTSVHTECDMQDMREVVVSSEVFGVLASGPVGFGMYVVYGLGGDVLVKKRSKTIEQAAPISVDEAAGSTGYHPHTPPPVVTTMESVGDCGMDDGPVKKKPYMDKQRDIQAIKAGLPNKTCLRRRPGHVSLDVTPGATLPLVYDQYNRRKQYQCSRMYKNKHLSK